jgi:hypothetical protein
MHRIPALRDRPLVVLPRGEPADVMHRRTSAADCTRKGADPVQVLGIGVRLHARILFMGGKAIKAACWSFFSVLLLR